MKINYTYFSKSYANIKNKNEDTAAISMNLTFPFKLIQKPTTR